MDLNIIIPILMVGGAFCAVVVIAYYNAKKKQKIKKVATDTNLDYSDNVPPYFLPKFDGKYRNHHVDVSIILKEREEDFGF